MEGILPLKSEGRLPVNECPMKFEDIVLIGDMPRSHWLLDEGMALEPDDNEVMRYSHEIFA